jgi:uncharacterized protein YdbL (DUF1318 family)
MKTLASIISMSVASGAVAFVAHAAQTSGTLYTATSGIKDGAEVAFSLDSKTQAETHAKIFASRIEEAQKLAEQSGISTRRAEQLRKDISTEFNITYALILEIENNGDIAEASLARAIMQNSIDYYVRNQNVASRNIEEDLLVYSKILTESLIKNSVRLLSRDCYGQLLIKC